MLVLTRKPGETVALDPNIQITLTQVREGVVRVSIITGNDRSTQIDELDVEQSFRVFRDRKRMDNPDADIEAIRNEWYCTEEFAELLTRHFHQAKKASIHAQPVDLSCELIVS